MHVLRRVTGKEASCLFFRGPNTEKELLGKIEGETECCDLRQMMREILRKPLITMKGIVEMLFMWEIILSRLLLFISREGLV